MSFRAVALAWRQRAGDGRRPGKRRRRGGRLASIRRTDDGQISVLVVGLFALAALLVIGGIDVTAAHVARVRLLDIADSAALDAADALDEGTAYRQGVGPSVTVSDASVRESVTAYLAARPQPSGVDAVGVEPATGTPDGRTAVVVLTGRARLPMTDGMLSALGSSVTITVEARARAPLTG